MSKPIAQQRDGVKGARNRGGKRRPGAESRTRKPKLRDPLDFTDLDGILEALGMPICDLATSPVWGIDNLAAAIEQAVRIELGKDTLTDRAANWLAERLAASATMTISERLTLHLEARLTGVHKVTSGWRSRGRNYRFPKEGDHEWRESLVKQVIRRNNERCEREVRDSQASLMDDLCAMQAQRDQALSALAIMQKRIERDSQAAG